jgi:hypothetical protein
VRNFRRSKVNARKAGEKSMDQFEGDEEARVVERYETFIKIKEEPDPGTSAPHIRFGIHDPDSNFFVSRRILW